MRKCQLQLSTEKCTALLCYLHIDDFKYHTVYGNYCQSWDQSEKKKGENNSDVCCIHNFNLNIT